MRVLLALVAAALILVQQAPDRALLLNPGAPEFQQPAPERSVIRLDTSQGNIVLEVFRDWAPLGAARFVNLVRHGYYDEARFFRVTKGQWTQFGINGDPAIAKAWRGRTFPDEPFKQSNVRGTVAFAFAAPNGRTTQVFINMRDNSATHDKEPFVPFGRIIEGMDVADRITSEYGEGPGGIRAGRQDPFFDGGNPYLAREFPHLDYIKRAVIVALPAASVPPVRQGDHVTIRVDTSVVKGPMSPVWAWFGHDEPNYTYMKDGRKLLSELAALSPVPVYMRTHNLLTTGDGIAAFKWGSTNAYTENAAGRPRYDWTIVDRIFNTYLERGMKPLVQIGFMPEALSSHPTPYRHFWKPGDNYNDIYTGWSYPPNDYAKWGELVFQWVRHSVEQYGQREVESWWWEVWNEPDIGYWHGTPEEFQKLYDYAVDGLKRALPTARVGGPEVTGPNGARTQTILKNFIEHCLRGTNFATGRIGSPLDFVTFHAKGAPQVMPDGHVRMSVSNQLRAIANGFGIVASFPELAQTPIVIGESDPEGCAACPVRTNPSNAYRNGTMFSSYTAEQLARTYELADLHHVNLMGALSWAFEFEDQPYFDGFRDLATNGIDKPVLNTFRMLGQMAGARVAVESSGGLPLADVRDRSVRQQADVSALASRDARSASVLVWNYHDDDLPGPAAEVELTIEGLPPGRPTLTHARVDTDHSNSYTVWKAMGSPQAPTPAQYAALEKAGQLQALEPARQVDVKDGRVVVTFTLPRQGVSLVKIVW
jgi:xylan 1,4-beta-xylosidase